MGGAITVTFISGSILLAKSSDGFRNFSEKYIPGTSYLYKLILGPKVEKIPVVVTKPDDSLMKKKLEREAAKKKDSKTHSHYSTLLNLNHVAGQLSDLMVIKTGGAAPILEPPKVSEEIVPSTESPVPGAVNVVESVPTKTAEDPVATPLQEEHMIGQPIEESSTVSLPLEVYPTHLAEPTINAVRWISPRVNVIAPHLIIFLHIRLNCVWLNAAMVER